MGLVPRYATIARHLNVVKRRCKGTEFCTTLWARKSEVRFRTYVAALLKKTSDSTFSNVSYLAPEVFYQLRTMFFSDDNLRMMKQCL